MDIGADAPPHPRNPVILPRFMYLATLLCLLGACGGERAANADASGSTAGDTARGSDGSTASAAGETRIPAFVREADPATDSAESTGAASSVYTSLAEADCRLVEQDEETGDTTSRCPGTAGYGLLLHDWDARMTLDVVVPGGRAHPLRYSGVITSNFSSLGPRAEWRMRGGKPIALIVRLNAFEDPEVTDRATSYLAVAKITAREVCVTDRIPPTTPNANEAARQAADRSASRPCMRDLGS